MSRYVVPIKKLEEQDDGYLEDDGYPNARELLSDEQLKDEERRRRKMSKEHTKITVKELIIKLLECEMDWEVEVENADGSRLHGIKIVAIKPEGLHCLFG